MDRQTLRFWPRAGSPPPCALRRTIHITSMTAIDPASLPTATRLAFEAATALGMAFEVLDPDYGYLYEVRDGGRRRAFLGGRSALNDAVSARLAEDKHYASLLLARAGLTVPETVRCLSPRHPSMASFRDRAGMEPGVALAEMRGLPLVVKPNRLSHGRGVAHVDSVAALRVAIEAVWDLDAIALVQTYAPGVDLRLDFLDGRFLAGYERRAIVLEGDGRRTIEALMTEQDPRMAVPEAKKRLMVALTPALAARGWTERTVIAEGDGLDLTNPIRNLNLGSAPCVLSEAPEGTADACLRAGRAIGLRHFGVDCRVATDGETPRVTIIEINASPLLSQIYLGGHRDVAVAAQKRVLRAAMSAAPHVDASGA